MSPAYVNENAPTVFLPKTLKSTINNKSFLSVSKYRLHDGLDKRSMKTTMKWKRNKNESDRKKSSMPCP